MENYTHATLKIREIEFAEIHPDPNQAHTAAQMLCGVSGVISVNPRTCSVLEISYDVLQISLEQIEAALTEVGFHLSSRLLCRVRRALHYYAEETQRANNGCPRGSSNCTRKVFISRYASKPHGCRDQRPEHWRRYL